MSTVVLWLLITCDHACVVIDRFQTRADCEETRVEAIRGISSGFYQSRTACIQAKVVRP